MDKLRSMEVFVAAVDAGSFAGAAKSCGLSAVMVGKHIRQLETLLGASLLTRTTRRHALTEIGRQYAVQCRQILTQIDAAESVAERMRAAPRGLLRVTAPVTYGAQWLSPAVTDYLERWPDVTVELNLNDRMIDLVEDGFDVAVRIGALADSSMIARPLQPYRMAICAAPVYLAKRGTPLTPADLARHECLDFTGWDPQTRWQLRGEKDGRAVPPSRFRANRPAHGCAGRFRHRHAGGNDRGTGHRGRPAGAAADGLPAATAADARALLARPAGHAEADDVCGVPAGAVRGRTRVGASAPG